MPKFDNSYPKEKYLYEENTIYIGLYVLRVFELFRIYFLIPFFYIISNIIFIWSGTFYYRFFEFSLFFMLIVLLLVAEISKYIKNLFAWNRSGRYVLNFNVCIILIQLFIIYIFLVYYYMDLTISYKIYNFHYNFYFGSSLITDWFRLIIAFLFVINIFFSFSYVYFSKKLSYEFYILLAMAYCFLLMCLICRNLFLLLMLIEGLSLSLIGCICLTKTKSAYEVALKFFILSAIFAILGVFGALLILMSTNTLDYRNLSFVSCFSLLGTINLLVGIEKPILLVGVILIISALLFKLGVYPFHAYVADFAAVSFYPLLFFFLGPLKLGIFFVVILVYLVFFLFVDELNIIFLFVGLTSILIGAKGAVSENELKKFLGFTSINQLGFVLISISVPGFSSISAAFVFFFVYLMSNILFFYVPMQCFDKNNNEAFIYLNHFAYYSKLDSGQFCNSILVENDNTNIADKSVVNENIFIETSIKQIIEVDSREKFNYQFRIIVLLFSFIGIPPLPGFGGKYLIFYNLVLNSHAVIAFIVMFISLISAYYYLNLIYKLFNKNLTPSFLVNYEFLKVYDNFIFNGFHTFFFWAFLVVGIVILDPIFFYSLIQILKDGF